MAFRESAEQASEGFKNIRLRWVNKATNFGCTAVEANYSPEGAATELGGTWDLVETILDPAVSEFLHVAVPAQGDVCYRVYAANALGRSEYSNRVCLELGEIATPTPDTGEGGGDSSEGDSSAPVLIIVVVVLVAILVVGGGVVMMRGRAGRAG